MTKSSQAALPHCFINKATSVFKWFFFYWILYFLYCLMFW